MSYQTLTTSIDNGIFLIAINRPDKLNALNRQVMQELSHVVDQLYGDPGIRSAIITGSGEKAFVAGADINEFKELSVAEAKSYSLNGQELFFRIENSPKPVIACVNGYALGGGCELAMSCHFRIASDNAKFGLPEATLGLIPGYGGTQRLAQLIGKGRALEMLLSAMVIDANTALEYGLVNYVVAPGQLLEKANSILELINTKSPLVINKCIRLVNDFYEEGKNGYAEEAEAFRQCFETEDMKEGVTAFLEKRKPAFTGK